MNRQFKYGSVLAYVSILLTILSGILYTPWMISVIGQSEYGLYTLANSLITLFLLDFGLSSATSKYMAKYAAEGNKSDAQSFLGAICKLYLGLDLVITSILTIIFFSIENIYVNLTAEELEKFKVVFVLCGTFSLINFPFVNLNGVLTAYEKFVHLKLIEIFQRILNIILTVICLSLGYGVYSLVAVHIVVSIITILTKLFIIGRDIKIKPFFRQSHKGLYKKIFLFSFWITISSLAGRLVFSVTPSILGIFTNSAAIAVFGIVTTIESYSYTITTAISSMYIPKVSKIFAFENAVANLNRVFCNVGKFQFTLNGIILVGIITLGKQFIALWAGNEYIDAYWCLVLILTPGLFFNSLQIANTALIVNDKVKYEAILSIITGCINVGLSVPLSAQFGAIGSCVAISIAFTVKAIVMHIISYKIIGLNIKHFIKTCYLKIAPVLLLSIILGFALNQVVSGNSWLTFFMKALIIVLVYLILIFVVAINREERQKVISTIKKL